MKYCVIDDERERKYVINIYECNFFVLNGNIQIAYTCPNALVFAFDWAHGGLKDGYSIAFKFWPNHQPHICL